MTYEYNKDLSTKDFEIKIATNDHYGYFEHHKLGDECGGGIWFDPSGEVVDYDGVFELPRQVKDALLGAGYFGEALS